MGTTQPIRKQEDLERFLEYYKTVHPSKRNYVLLILGIYTALRISDILSLRWMDVFNFKTSEYNHHVFIEEQKTGKTNIIALNRHVKDALESYRQERTPAPTDYIFTKTTDYTKPLNRTQAFRIVKRAAKESLLPEHISCHSLRKTFGYHAWKQGTPPALLMDIYNHSSYRVTKKYLGIEQDERDSIFMDIEII